MKKLLVIAFAGLFVASMAATAQAQMGSELELSGHVNTQAAWQRTLKNTGHGAAGLMEGSTLAATTKGEDQFGFNVNEVELDLAKSFGENIRLRSDLDFSPNNVAGAFNVEQAYVTANIPAGNGAELLVGQFNSGIGLDPYDQNELHTMSFSMPRRVALPFNLTGARIGYQATDAVWFDLYVVNNLQDGVDTTVGGGTTSDYPSFGFDVKYGWGDEDAMSWVKLSAAAGAESATNKDFTYLGDVSGNVALMDGAFDAGFEGFYRMDSNVAATTTEAKLLGGLVQGTYAFSDIWDGTFRYGFTWDNDAIAAAPAANYAAAASGLGAAAKGKLHDISLATGYQITDGAKLVVEGRFDIYSPTGGSTGYSAGLGTLFAYSF